MDATSAAWHSSVSSCLQGDWGVKTQVSSGPSRTQGKVHPPGRTPTWARQTGAAGHGTATVLGPQARALV